MNIGVQKYFFITLKRCFKQYTTLRTLRLSCPPPPFLPFLTPCCSPGVSNARLDRRPSQPPKRLQNYKNNNSAGQAADEVVPLGPSPSSSAADARAQMSSHDSSTFLAIRDADFAPGLLATNWGSLRSCSGQMQGCWGDTVGWREGTVGAALFTRSCARACYTQLLSNPRSCKRNTLMSLYGSLGRRRHHPLSTPFTHAYGKKTPFPTTNQ